jgi:hypothetical protein
MLVRPVSFRLYSARTFAAAVLRALTWKAVLITQVLGVALAVQYWLERVGPGQPRFAPVLIEQALSALCMTLAALAADQAVRRGRGIWHAFTVTLFGIVGVIAAIQWGIGDWLGVSSPDGGLGQFQYFAFSSGGWSTALLVYLNRRSAQRVLAGVRAVELARVTTERSLIASRLAAAQTQMDPAAVLRELAEVRDLYAGAQPTADHALDRLITRLRDSATARHAAR